MSDNNTIFSMRMQCLIIPDKTSQVEGERNVLHSVTHTRVGLAGVDLVDRPVLLWRWKVFNRVEVELGFKIICRRKENKHKRFKMCRHIKSQGLIINCICFTKKRRWTV